MISTETADRLRQVAEQQNNYHLDDSEMHVLKRKTLVAIIGPAAVGKTTVMEEIAATDARFGRVGSITTRDPRPNDDPTFYRYIPHTDAGLAGLLNRIDNHELVQYAIHPTNGRVYASELAMYPHKYSMMDAMASSVDSLKRIPFEKHVIIGLTTEVEAWKKWFDLHYPPTADERARRLAEAITSIEWSLSQPDDAITWVENKPGNIQKSGRTIIDIADNDKKPDTLHRDKAVRMLELIKDLE